jgi:outer membrane protein
MVFSRTSVWIVALVGSAAMLAPRPAVAEEAAPRSVTLEDCLKLAAESNPDLRSAEDEVDAATYGRYGAMGSFGPKVGLQASYLRWDKPLTVNFADWFAPLVSTLPIPIDLSGIEPITMREQVTKSLGVTVTQPITPLWTILEAYNLRDLGLDVAEIKRQASMNDVAYQVTEAFYRVLQTKGLLDIAEKSVAQVTSQVERARAFLAQGMVGENDVLRAELGLAAGKQRLIQARGNVLLTTARLASLLGLPADTALTPIADVAQVPKHDLPAPDEVQERALEHRPEIKELAARTAQARAARRLAWSKMLPTLAAVGNYSINKGANTMFQPERAWYVGGVLSWDVWEWGASYFGTREADARLKQALDAHDKIENLLRLEVRSTQVNLSSAAEALQVVESAVKQAEENFRIENKRYEAASSTTFDVLDAETLLTTARTQQQTALYDFIIARAALSRVMGERGLP